MVGILVLRRIVMLKKAKPFIVIGVIVLIVFGLWSVSRGLVNMGKSSYDIVKEYKDTTEIKDNTKDKVLQRDTIKTPDGEIKNQVGTSADKSVQCVYDYFEEYLPELRLCDKEYELKDLGDNNYCINIGDWYIFVKNENNISYPYKFTKSVPFTDEEKEYISIREQGSVFEEEGDLYVWKVIKE